MVSSCSRGGSGWTWRGNFSQKMLLYIGMGSPGRRWGHHPWRRCTNGWILHLVQWSSWQVGDQSRVGLDDPGGLFQPRWFYDSEAQDLPFPLYQTTRNSCQHKGITLNGCIETQLVSFINNYIPNPASLSERSCSFPGCWFIHIVWVVPTGLHRLALLGRLLGGLDVWSLLLLS